MRINLGIRRRLAPLLDNDRRKIELANSLLFTLPGSPIIYYGDEIGMGDNIQLFDRNGVRTPMQWDSTPSAGFTSGKPFIDLLGGDFSPAQVNVAAQIKDADSLFHTLQRMIQIRKEHHAFGRGTLTWLETNNASVLALQREYDGETLLCIHNLSSQPQTFKAGGQYLNLFTNQSETLNELSLIPLSYHWYKKL
jgi:maltose alpha-D-glucosyltransferase/alpha-amylase